MPVPTPRVVRVAVTGALCITIVFALWSAMVGTLTSSQPPGFLLIAATAANLIALVARLLAGRPNWLWLATATALALAIALPVVSVYSHGAQPSSDPTPWMAGMAGAGAALAVVAVGPLSRTQLLLIALVAATIVVWASSVLGLQTAMGGPVDVSYLSNEREWLSIWQLRGIAGHPNGLAIVAALALLLQVDFIRRRADRDFATMTGMILLGPVTSVSVLVWTQSRVGWIAGLAVIILFLPWLRDRRGLLAAAVVTAGGAISLAPLLAVTTWSMKAGNVYNALAFQMGPLRLVIDQSSFHGRSYAWMLAEQGIAGAPLLGPGPAMFGSDYWETMTRTAVVPWEPVHAHSVFLQAGILMGVIGIATVTAALAGCAAIGVLARRRDRGLTLAALFALAVMAGVEPALGAGLGGAVYLPALLVGLIVGAGARSAVNVGRDSASRHLPRPTYATSLQ